MSKLHDDVLDDGLQVLTDSANVLYICSAEPANFAGIAAVTLGSKDDPTVGAPAARNPSGRKVTVSAISDGAVTANGTATHWALADTSGSRLLAANTLSASQVVTNGNVFMLGAFDVGIPGPA